MDQSSIYVGIYMMDFKIYMQTYNMKLIFVDIKFHFPRNPRKI